MRRLSVFACIAALCSALTAHAQTFSGGNSGSSLWGIAEGSGFAVAAGTDGGVAIQNGGPEWHHRILPGAPLLLAVAVRAGTDIFIAGSRSGFVNGDSLILKSTDRGASFEALSVPQGKTLYEIEFLNATTGFAAGAYGTLLRTTDSGETWQSLGTGTRENLWAVHFFDTETGLAGGGDTPWQNDGNSSGIIRRTVDGGATWQTVHNGSQRISDFAFIDHKTGYAVGVGGVLLETDNGGATWEPAEKTPLGAIANAVEFTSLNCGIVVGAGGTAYVTRDGGRTWSSTIAVTKGSFLEDLYPASTGGVWVAAGDGTTGRISLGGNC